MKLLIIEDDALLTLALYRTLGSTYELDSAQNGRVGLRKAYSQAFDVIILDLHLPDMHGLQACEQLRSSDIKTPILVLSGEAATESKVTLLDSGADDYLTKPFDADELHARLRSITRKAPNRPTSRTRLVVGDLVLDTIKHSVKRAEQDIQLTRKEFSILEYLMQHAGVVIPRSMLAQHIWRDGWVSSANTIDVHIKYLRDKVDRPFKTPLIKTVRGLGYKIDASKVAAK